MKKNNLFRTSSKFFGMIIFLLSSSLMGYGQKTIQTFSRNQLIELKRIGVMIGQGKPDNEVQGAWSTLVKNNKDINIDVAVNNILSEAKLEAQRNVDIARNRVQVTSMLKEQVSNEIKTARLNLIQVDKTKEPVTMQVKTFNPGPGIQGKIIVNQTGSISTPDEITSYVNELEVQLNSIGDDAQLANIDLQNVLQKQQQLLQMLSNISKTLNDTALAIIRKIG